MRYALVADNLHEQRFVDGDVEMKAALDVLLPLLTAKSLMLVTRLGVLDLMRNGPCSAQALSNALSVDSETLDLILRIVSIGGYISRRNGEYELTPLARKALLTDSKSGCRHFVHFIESLWNALGGMQRALEQGVGLDVHENIPAGDWANYQQAMLEDARSCAAVVAALVPVQPGARKLLDIGGSHGLYGAKICREHPPMTSRVIELPAAVKDAEILARAEGVTDVVTHRAGNVLKDSLGEDNDNDVVLLCNILHHLSEADSVSLLERVRSSMRASGTVAIWEWAPPDATARPDIVRDGLALFFRTTSRGRLWSADQYSRWLTTTGFVEIRLRRVASMPHRIMLTARA